MRNYRERREKRSTTDNQFANIVVQYTGQWLGDKPDGYGHLITSKGNSHIGQLMDGKANARSEYKMANGERFQGNSQKWIERWE